MYIDYDDCIVNLASSILKYFGAESEHKSLKVIDNLLEHQFQNVVVLLLDGLGMDALQYHLNDNDFFRKNLLKTYSSVFPPTTTSATTTLESGLTPLEHGWLGWCLYFNEIDKIVNAFINTVKDTDTQAADFHVANQFIPYKTIYQRIKDAGVGNAYSVSKFGSNKIATFDELTEEITRLCKIPEKKYIYGYWENPDGLMHDYGCYDKIVTNNIKELQSRIEEMCNQLSNTLVIITADHGHINIKHYVLTNYPKIINMLKRPISIETRATAFHIKEEYLEAFPIEFQNQFGEEFLLLSKQDVIEQQLFGKGKRHPRFEEMIGDYLAIAVSDRGIVYSENSNQYISNHAGFTEKEMRIPIIGICKA